MGFPIARNLAGAGFKVQAWNRTREKAEPLEQDGVSVAASAADAAAGADIVVTMLSDADAVLEAMAGERGALAQATGATWVQMSTVGIEGIERCAELAERMDVGFVDAPVLGTKQPAEQGELIVLASGKETARGLCEPLFATIGKKTLWLGEAGAGSRLKVVANSWIVAVVEGLAETLALAEGIHVDPASFFEAISGGPLDLPYARMKGAAMIERDFAPSFSLAMAAKDARLAELAAMRHGLELPVLEAIRRRMEEGAEEHGDEDIAATFRTSAPG
jgi:3-hydroxyisobutyrate dehydrogenase